MPDHLLAIDALLRARAYQATQVPAEAEHGNRNDDPTDRDESQPVEQ